MTVLASRPSEIDYPEDDGNSLSDHTLQYDWITLIKDNLEAVFADDPDVFVAGNLLWYPVEGDNRTRVAPDVMVVFGRPKGERGSYRQWQEDGIAPQIVFEILSPGNRPEEMINKAFFYDRHKVREYYLYDPFTFEFDAWLRNPETGRLEPQDTTNGFVSPLLGIRFVRHEKAPMEVFGRDGKPFVNFTQLRREREAAERERENAERRADAMAARLRELGIDPDSV